MAVLVGYITAEQGISNTDVSSVEGQSPRQWTYPISVICDRQRIISNTDVIITKAQKMGTPHTLK